MASDGTAGEEVWQVAADDTVSRVADINRDSLGSHAEQLREFNGSLYFTADDGERGIELWQIAADDTARIVTDLNPGPAESYPFFPEGVRRFAPFSGRRWHE